jgi:hypothetical protein
MAVAARATSVCVTLERAKAPGRRFRYVERSLWARVDGLICNGFMLRC